MTTDTAEDRFDLADLKPTKVRCECHDLTFRERNGRWQGPAIVGRDDPKAIPAVYGNGTTGLISIFDSLDELTMSHPDLAPVEIGDVERLWNKAVQLQVNNWDLGSVLEDIPQCSCGVDYKETCDIHGAVGRLNALDLIATAAPSELDDHFKAIAADIVRDGLSEGIPAADLAVAARRWGYACPSCHGAGGTYPGGFSACDECGGGGPDYYDERVRELLGMAAECATCQGSGSCTACRGGSSNEPGLSCIACGGSHNCEACGGTGTQAPAARRGRCLVTLMDLPPARKAADIPDAVFLNAVDEAARRRGVIDAVIWDVTTVLAGHPELVKVAPIQDWLNMPHKVVAAKARKLINRGLLTGCGCGNCRGDLRRVPQDGDDDA